MMPSSKVCVDANLVVRRVVANVDDLLVLDLWSRWTDSHVQLVAPGLIRYEVTNAIHRLGGAASYPPQTVDALVAAALDLPIEIVSDIDLHLRALEFARRFQRPATYDAHYLALAERLGVEFWTADKRLVNAVGPALPWVRLLGEGAEGAG